MQAGVEQAAASHRVADSGDQDGRGEFTVVLQPGEFLFLQKLLSPFPGFETVFGQCRVRSQRQYQWSAT